MLKRFGRGEGEMGTRICMPKWNLHTRDTRASTRAVATDEGAKVPCWIRPSPEPHADRPDAVGESPPADQRAAARPHCLWRKSMVSYGSPLPVSSFIVETVPPLKLNGTVCAGSRSELDSIVRTPPTTTSQSRLGAPPRRSKSRVTSPLVSSLPNHIALKSLFEPTGASFTSPYASH